ncbi:hypothetical protein [Fulvivirga sp.]|uniref:hypothetical protein n=1 Tax=Fulvivirga sp. TaxID=1931237 RepID=UPI0032EBCCF9
MKKIVSITFGVFLYSLCFSCSNKSENQSVDKISETQESSYLIVSGQEYLLKQTSCVELGGVGEESNLLVFTSVNEDLDYQFTVTLLTNGLEIKPGEYHLLDHDYLATINFNNAGTSYLNIDEKGTVAYSIVENRGAVTGDLKISSMDSDSEKVAVKFKLICE